MNLIPRPRHRHRVVGLAGLLSLLLLAGPGHAQMIPAVEAMDSVFTTQPVRLVYFIAWQYHSGGELHWVTTHEDEDSQAFEVEQSSNGNRWQTLATMPAHPGSLTRYNYVYYDPNLSHYGVPRLYYRLRQVGRSGRFTYSPVRLIRLGTPEAAVSPGAGK